MKSVSIVRPRAEALRGSSGKNPIRGKNPMEDLLSTQEKRSTGYRPSKRGLA
jgi:hypothetical protein